MCIATWLLFSEYFFFRKQSEKLIELQNDYRTYISAVNKILHDYNKTKEKLDILETSTSCIAGEKKKEIDFIGLGFYSHTFPEGAEVFSSDNASDRVDSFILVNRDREHLKSSSVNYFKNIKDSSLPSAVNFSDWVDYTQYAVLGEASRTCKVQKKNVQKKRNKKVASYRGPQTRRKKSKKGDVIFSWPLNKKSFWMSSFFGPRKKPNGSWGFHYGLDMAAVRGTPVYSASSGIVIEARYSHGYGNTIVITHGRKYRTRYAHLNNILVRVGQKVRRRQLIGKVGRTGLVWKTRGRDPSHLHFEVHAFGKQVNPLKFLV